mgnify:FL=1
MRFAICLILLVSVFSVQSQEKEDFVLIQNSEIIGYLTVVKDQQATINIDYFVDTNGRGPKIKEALVLNSEGYPVDWKIEGFSSFGAPVLETFTWKDGQGNWVSQSDHGTSNLPSTPLYIASNSSPWSFGLYARALLESDDRTLSALPPQSLLKLKEIKNFLLTIK